MIARARCAALLFPIALTLGVATESMAQDRSPQILEIYRDYLKPDAVAANRKLEKRAEHLCRTLGFTHPYLTIESVSAPAEMWYFASRSGEAEAGIRAEHEVVGGS